MGGEMLKRRVRDNITRSFGMFIRRGEVKQNTALFREEGPKFTGDDTLCTTFYPWLNVEYL